MKFFNYVKEVGGLAQLGTIDKVTSTYKSLLEAMKTPLHYERYITDSIYKIVPLFLVFLRLIMKT